MFKKKNIYIYYLHVRLNHRKENEETFSAVEKL